jgi:hypothetical protein
MELGILFLGIALVLWVLRHAILSFRRQNAQMQKQLDLLALHVREISADISRLYHDRVTVAEATAARTVRLAAHAQEMTDAVTRLQMIGPTSIRIPLQEHLPPGWSDMPSPPRLSNLRLTDPFSLVMKSPRKEKEAPTAYERILADDLFDDPKK